MRSRSSLNNIRLRSAKLYSDSAHFLFELIQNADDNQYEDTNPTMGIIYEEIRGKRTLRIDCNEIGFSRANVDAICSLSESSKSQPGRQREHIGEKGIGFKSVFAVANVVIIRSGYYSFKFINDKSEPLAMIVPHWVEYQENEAVANTSIFLQLSADFSPKSLIKKLKSMNPAFLMFLKNLQEMKIQLKVEKITQQWVWKRDDFGPEVHGLAPVTVYRGQEYIKYVVLRKKVSDLPYDDRRIGITETDLMLVFPIHSSSSDTENTPSYVHAFLPIRNYGLKVSY